ncbi:MAG: hypothetical protein Q3972_05990 [Corynebacterium sp.]|nr:hypothetical protein [Corynebacterium sp.]
MRIFSDSRRALAGIAILAMTGTLTACSMSSASTDTPPGPSFPSEATAPLTSTNEESSSTVTTTPQSSPEVNLGAIPNAMNPNEVPNDADYVDDEIITIEPLMPELVLPGQAPKDPNAEVMTVVPAPPTTDFRLH